MWAERFQIVPSSLLRVLRAFVVKLNQHATTLDAATKGKRALVLLVDGDLGDALVDRLDLGDVLGRVDVAEAGFELGLGQIFG